MASQFEPKEVAQVILADGVHEVAQSSFEVYVIYNTPFATWIEQQKMRDATTRRVYAPFSTIVAFAYAYR